MPSLDAQLPRAINYLMAPSRAFRTALVVCAVAAMAGGVM